MGRREPCTGSIPAVYIKLGSGRRTAKSQVPQADDSLVGKPADNTLFARQACSCREAHLYLDDLNPSHRMSAPSALPDTGAVGFYVQRVWPWGRRVAFASIATGILLVFGSAWLLRGELEAIDPKGQLGLAALAAAAAGAVSSKIAKDFAERIAQLLGLGITVGALLAAGGAFGDGGVTATQFISVMLLASALQLIVVGAWSLRFQAAVEEDEESFRRWSEVEGYDAEHSRPSLPLRPIGPWEVFTAPLLLVTFRGLFAHDVERTGLVLVGFIVIYALLLVTMTVYFVVPRMALTRAVWKEEAERHLSQNGAVPGRSLLLRRAWKRPGTWRRATLPRSGPYRLAALRRVCKRLGIPEPASEYELEKIRP
jgi:hypothetical protein